MGSGFQTSSPYPTGKTVCDFESIPICCLSWPVSPAGQYLVGTARVGCTAGNMVVYHPVA